MGIEEEQKKALEETIQAAEKLASDKSKKAGKAALDFAIKEIKLTFNMNEVSQEAMEALGDTDILNVTEKYEKAAIEALKKADVKYNHTVSYDENGKRDFKIEYHIKDAEKIEKKLDKEIKKVKKKEKVKDEAKSLIGNLKDKKAQVDKNTEKSAEKMHNRSEMGGR